ncbi:hypothetical protein UY3_03861 [Chelonia mydas]|uniref:Uncharacterized protein n=1 Tax=Chelonia mydas TaxID=8469 RepID=M7BNT3_CHEMY|nr:hypothetical protein UY3_03861 [Chelonia mydas]
MGTMDLDYAVDNEPIPETDWDAKTLPAEKMPKMSLALRYSSYANNVGRLRSTYPSVFTALCRHSPVDFPYSAWKAGVLGSSRERSAVNLVDLH